MYISLDLFFQKMSDSDVEIELTRANSNPNFESAPVDKEFKIIVKPKELNKVGILYTLKSGQSLPYSPMLKGTFLQKYHFCMQ